ncbi:unnamed protein product [Linum trigynum]|uniref:CCHC-type domain-containing protein n=1 Tax=Linum trigynum TaxID=586398 RepID=A0AAV2D0Y3_9ROSI
MRNALISLLAFAIWIGEGLIQGVCSLFAASVRNQESGLHGSATSEQSHQPSGCRPSASGKDLGKHPLRVWHPRSPLCSRAFYTEGPYERKHEVVCLLRKRKLGLAQGQFDRPPEPRPKKVRVQPLKGWRLWLPPSFDMGSEETKLHQSGTGEDRVQENNKASDPMSNPPIQAHLVWEIAQQKPEVKWPAKQGKNPLISNPAGGRWGSPPILDNRSGRDCRTNRTGPIIRKSNSDSLRVLGRNLRIPLSGHNRIRLSCEWTPTCVESPSPIRNPIVNGEIDLTVDSRKAATAAFFLIYTPVLRLLYHSFQTVKNWGTSSRPAILIPPSAAKQSSGMVTVDKPHAPSFLPIAAPYQLRMLVTACAENTRASTSLEASPDAWHMTQRVSPVSLFQDRIMVHVSEDQVFQFSMDEVLSTKVRAARSMLGRLITAEQFSTLELRDAVIDAWQIKGRVKVTKANYELFEIMLPNEEAKNWALKRSPWIIKDKILCLRPWTSSIPRPIFEELAVAPFRVQIWGVKEDCCTKLFGRKMVSAAIGQVLESDVFACKETGERFIKVRTLIDFSKPLRSQLYASNDDIGGFWVNLRYEYLPSLCYHCGRVGHSRRECSFDPPHGRERFGPHMSTKKVGRKVFEEEDEGPKFGGPRRSVWVNRQISGPVGSANQPRTDTRGSDEQGQISIMGGGENSRPAKGGSGQPDPRLQPPEVPKLSSGTASPRGFIVKKSPKVQIGGGRGKRNMSRGKETKKPEQSRMPGGQKMVSCGEGGDGQTMFEQTRRRRIILEADPDDDALEFEQQPPAEGDSGERKLGPMEGGEGGMVEGHRPAGAVEVGRTQVGNVAGPGVVDQTEMGRVITLEDGPGHPTPNVAKAGPKSRLRKAGPPKTSAQAGPLKKASSRPRRGPGADNGGKRAAVPHDQAKGSGPKGEIIRALVLAESDSEEEAPCFEIKRRPPKVQKMNQSMDIPTGQVSQVVAAFEAGMDITVDQEPVIHSKEISIDPG